MSKKDSIKKAIKIFFAVILILIICANLLTVVFSSLGIRNQLKWMPYAFLNVTSGSMEPDIFAGDAIVVTDTPYEELKKGDIVTYNDNFGGFTTHRIVSIGPENFITRGTANNSADDPVKRESYCAKMVAVIPKAGAFVEFITRPVPAIVAIVIILILFYAVPALIDIASNKKEEQQVEKANKAGKLSIRNLIALALATALATVPFMTAARYKSEIYNHEVVVAAYSSFKSNYLSPVTVSAAGDVSGESVHKIHGWNALKEYNINLEIRNYINSLRFNDTVNVPYILYFEKDNSTEYIKPEYYTISVISMTEIPTPEKTDPTLYHRDIEPNNVWSTEKGVFYGPYLLMASESASLDQFKISVSIDESVKILNKDEDPPEGVTKYIRRGDMRHFKVMSCTVKDETFYQELKGDITFDISESDQFVTYKTIDQISGGGAASTSFVDLEFETNRTGQGGEQAIYIYWDASKLTLNRFTEKAKYALAKKGTVYYNGTDEPDPSQKTQKLGRGCLILQVEALTKSQLQFEKGHDYLSVDLSNSVKLSDNIDFDPSF